MSPGKCINIYLITFLLFSITPLTFAQNPNSPEYQFAQESLSNIIHHVQEDSSYTFFYLPEWLNIETEPKTVSADDIDNLLKELTAGTLLNYYILEEEKRVFIFPHTYIYESLPLNFFGEEVSQTPSQSALKIKDIPPPIFLENTIARPNNTEPVTRLGKFNPGNLKSTYKIKGIALIEETLEPIPDLAIQVEGEDRTVITNDKGEYELNLPPGYHRLSLSAMGIENVVKPIILYNDGTLNLYLEEGVERLEEVIVQGDLQERFSDAISGKEQVNSEKSKNIPLVLGERNILEIARSLPGISSAGEGAAGINVRGGKSDQNLVLLDKATLYNPTHFFGIFQALNPFTTSGVEIYKGALPIAYGGRLSSVFNIRTKHGNTRELSAEGSVGPITANLALEVPIQQDTSSLIIGGRAAYADWVLRSLEEPSLNSSEASFFDGIVKYHHRLNKENEINTSLYYSRDNFSITSDSLYHYSNRLASLLWDHIFTETKRGAFSLTYSGYDFGIRFDGQSDRDFRLRYRIDEAGLQYGIRQRLNDKNMLEYGATSKFYLVHPGSIEPLNSSSTVENITLQKERAMEGAFYIGDEITVSEKMQLNLGVRYAYFANLGKSIQRRYQENQPRNEATVRDTVNFGSGEIVKFYGAPELRASARYFLAPDLALKASVSNAFQFIHTLSNNTTVSPIDTWKLSDLNIKPQHSFQGTLGFFKNFDKDQFEVSLEGYYKRLENVLDFKTGARLFMNENVETAVLQGDGKSYGIEFLLKKSQGDLNGWLSYTFSRSLYRFNGNSQEERINNGDYFPSNFDKPHDISLLLNYRFTRRYSASANMVYQTGRPVTYPIGTYSYNNSEYVAYSNRNEFRIPDYYRLDIGLNIEGNHKLNKLAHSFVTISVYNVLGRNNPYSVYFINDSGEIKALQSSIFAIPIPSITYNFKF